MKDVNFNPSMLIEKSKSLLLRLGHYAIVFFILLLIAVYGFVLLRLEDFRSVQPNDADVSAQVQASATPHVNPTVVQQIETLQNNSISVQALFDQARNSPFQE